MLYLAMPTMFHRAVCLPACLLLCLTLLTVCCTVTVNGQSALSWPPSVTSAPYFTSPDDPETRSGFVANLVGGVSVSGSAPFAVAQFGPLWPTTNMRDGIPQFRPEVALPDTGDDTYGCSALTRSAASKSLVGKAVLLERGPSGCSYTIKARYAALAGAALTIVFGCPLEAPTYCSSGLVIMAGTEKINVPAIYMMTAHGQIIRSYLNTRRNLTALNQTYQFDTAVTEMERNLTLTSLLSYPPLFIEMVASGPIKSNELQALKDIMAVSALGASIGSKGGLIRWESLPEDPCLGSTRIAGVICENGHIVWIAMGSVGWTGILSPGWGEFTELRSLNLEGNRFTGEIPSSMCRLTKLRRFDIQQQRATTASAGGLTGVPSCLGEMTSLTQISLQYNSIPSLPNLAGLTRLQRLEVQYNYLTSLGGNWLTSLTSLTRLDLSSNRLTSSLPPFTGLTMLTEIALGGNNFTGSLQPDHFDDCSNLLRLDLASNSLSGSLPLLRRMPKLVEIQFTGNRFTGSIPSTWLELPSIQVIRVGSNQLVGPTPALAELMTPYMIDLSNNLLTEEIVDRPEARYDVGAFLSAVSGPSLATLNLENNRLVGAWNAGRLSLAINLTTLIIGGNGITTLPNDVFLSPLHFTYLDFHSNNISTWPNVAEPNSGLSFLDIRGNPDLVPDSLPSWVGIGTTMIQQQDEAGGLYLCPELTSTGTSSFGLRFLADATYSDYRGCTCAAGHFGAPPTCRLLPAQAQVTWDGSIVSNEIGTVFQSLVESNTAVKANWTATHVSSNTTSESATGILRGRSTISDEWYQSQRLTVGLTTSWTLNLTQTSEVESNGRPVLHHTYYLWTSGAFFTPTSSDMVSVYTGDAALLGTRLVVLTGASSAHDASLAAALLSSPEYMGLYGASLAQLPPPLRLTTQLVIGNMSTLHFVSRDQDGQHFLATYDYSYQCPAGYHEVRTGDGAHCTINMPHFKFDQGIRWAVWSTSIVTGILVIAVAVFILANWESKIIRAASRPFLLVLLAFLGLFPLGAALYATLPSFEGEAEEAITNAVSRAICVGRAWGSALPLTGVIAIMLAKSKRVDTIFSLNATKFSHKTVTDLDLAAHIGVLCTVTTLFLLFYSALPLVDPDLSEGSGSAVGSLVVSCEHRDGFIPWMMCLIAWFAVLMILTGVLAYRTRDLPSQYNESQHLTQGLFLLIFFGVILLPLAFFVSDSPNASVLIQGLGQNLLAIMELIIIFGPKIWFIYTRGHEPDRGATMIISSGESGSAHKAGSQSTAVGLHLVVSTLGGTTPIGSRGSLAARRASVKFPLAVNPNIKSDDPTPKHTNTNTNNSSSANTSMTPPTSDTIVTPTPVIPHLDAHPTTEPATAPRARHMSVSTADAPIFWPAEEDNVESPSDVVESASIELQPFVSTDPHAAPTDSPPHSAATPPIALLPLSTLRSHLQSRAAAEEQFGSTVAESDDEPHPCWTPTRHQELQLLKLIERMGFNNFQLKSPQPTPVDASQPMPAEVSHPTPTETSHPTPSQ